MSSAMDPQPHLTPAIPCGSVPGVTHSGPIPQKSLLIKLLVGADAPERCSQGLTVAATACLAGAQVSLWLTGEATRLVLNDADEPFTLDGATPPRELIATVQQFGQITACTQCLHRRGLTGEMLLPGVRIAGAASFVEELLIPGTTALNY